MIKTLLILLFISNAAFSAEKVNIIFKDDQVKQGSIVDATIVLDLETSQRLGNIGKLKDVSFGETFYIVSASPLLMKMNESLLKSDAKIIVQKIPESQPLTHNLNGQAIEVGWQNVQFIPTEAAQGFLFGTFEIPARLKLFRWVLLAAGIILVVGAVFWFRKRLTAKNKIKQRKYEIKDIVMSPREYQDVVSMWQKKSLVLKEYPEMEEHFRKLESVLFKYQFKPSQNEMEKAEVMGAYRDFVKNVEGGFRGI